MRALTWPGCVNMPRARCFVRTGKRPGELPGLERALAAGGVELFLEHGTRESKRKPSFAQQTLAVKQ